MTLLIFKRIQNNVENLSPHGKISVDSGVSILLLQQKIECDTSHPISLDYLIFIYSKYSKYFSKYLYFTINIPNTSPVLSIPTEHAAEIAGSLWS